MKKICGLGLPIPSPGDSLVWSVIGDIASMAAVLGVLEFIRALACRRSRRREMNEVNRGETCLAVFNGVV